MLIVLLLGRNLKYQLPTKNEWKTFLTSLHIVMGSVIGLSMRSVMWLVIAPVIGFIVIHGVGFYISKVASCSELRTERVVSECYLLQKDDGRATEPIKNMIKLILGTL